MSDSGIKQIDAHKTSHQDGGADEISVAALSGLLADDQHVLDTEVQAIKLDDLTAPDDNTDLNASTSKHGLVVKATAPAASLINVVGIANGETAYTNKALLDSTTPSDCDAVSAGSSGTATTAARRDHAHKVDAAIADDAVLTVDQADAADNDFAKFTANGLEGRSYSEVRTDLGLATGDSPQFTGIELGHASDTTLARSAAGTMTVEGKTVVTGAHYAEQGSIVYASGTNTPAELTHGATAGMLLQTGGHGANPSWVTVDDTAGGTNASIAPVTSNVLYDHGVATTAVHGVGAGTIAKTSDITATKLDDFTAPDDNTDLNASTSKHGLVVKATAPDSGLINMVGIANGETAYTNKALFDATVPSTQALGDSAAAGTATVSARRDHKHAMMSAAVASDLNTGTDTAKPVTSDALAGSIFGEKLVYIKVISEGTALTTGDGKAIITIPDSLNGMNLVDADAALYTVATGATLVNVSIYNLTDSQDMLSTPITIDASEYNSYTAATQPVINASYDDVATGDRISINVDAIGNTTPGNGLDVILTFQLP